MLSELAGVQVVVEWESPSWRVRWVDGPTRVQLLDRATARDGYGIGAPLRVAQMRFSRRVSAVATAVGWLAHGSQGGMAAEYDVDLWCANTAYPQRRAGAELLATAVVLAAVSRGDSAVLTALMTSAWPLLAPAALPGAVVEELPGRVISFVWPGRNGPPMHLLRPAETPVAPEPAVALAQEPTPSAMGVCARCGDALAGPVRRPWGSAGSLLQRSVPRRGPPRADHSIRDNRRYVTLGEFRNAGCARKVLAPTPWLNLAAGNGGADVTLDRCVT